MVVSNLVEQTLGMDAIESFLNGIIEHATEGIVTVDKDHTIVVFNRGAEAMFGWKAEDVINTPLNTILPVDIHDSHTKHMQRFAEGYDKRGGCRYSSDEYCREIEAPRRDGSTFPAEIAFFRTMFRNKNFYTAIIRDVTERKKHEEQIEKQEQELQAYRKAVKQKLLKQVEQVADLKADISSRGV